MSKVVVLGSLNVDVVTRVERHPSPGETVLGDGLARLAGGKGANQAVAAVAAGASVLMVGAVGSDDGGSAYLDRLRSLGVDVSRVDVRPEQPTGTALIEVSGDGENTIVVVPGANATVTWPAVELDAGDVLLAQLEIPLDTVATAVRAAAESGARVVLNLAPYADLPAGVLDLADPVVANEHEASQLAVDAPLAGGHPRRRGGDLGLPLHACRVGPRRRGRRHDRSRRRLLRRPRRRTGSRRGRRDRAPLGGRGRGGSRTARRSSAGRGALRRGGFLVHTGICR